MGIKIIADDKIPFLKGALESFADVEYMAGGAITRDHIKDTDALLIRTRTLCDKALLENSSVKFIGTATIGYDHIDTAWCESRGIVWKNAPGCNAGSVNQYMASTLVHLAREFGSLKNRVLGVVGVGNVGAKVVNTAERLGMRVYLCDPPRVRNEGVCGFISFEGILRECDIITFHVPLNLKGPDRTYHLINQTMLDSVNEGTIIINTSRGEVADGKALKAALERGKIAGAVLDVWENEPDIDFSLLDRCAIGTPHIAGYSADGKARGTAMVVSELSRFFGLDLDEWVPLNIPVPEDHTIRIDCKGRTEEEILTHAIESTYQVVMDDRRLREAPELFEKQRGDYPLRREFNAYTVIPDNGSAEINRILRRFGFNVK